MRETRRERRERCWKQRNPVHNRFIPDFLSSSTEGRTGQLECYVRRPDTPEHDLGPPAVIAVAQPAAGKQSPLLFNNSLGWGRTRFEPETACALSGALFENSAAPPRRFRFDVGKRVPRAEASKLAQWDAAARPPSVRHVRSRRVRSPAALHEFAPALSRGRGSPPSAGTARSGWDVRVGAGVPLPLSPTRRS
eukprot:g7233.t1